jgi:hypothetical protein
VYLFNSVFTHYGSFNWLPTPFVSAQRLSEHTVHKSAAREKTVGASPPLLIIIKTREPDRTALSHSPEQFRKKKYLHCFIVTVNLEAIDAVQALPTSITGTFFQIGQRQLSETA